MRRLSARPRRPTLLATLAELSDAVLVVDEKVEGEIEPALLHPIVLAMGGDPWLLAKKQHSTPELAIVLSREESCFLRIAAALLATKVRSEDMRAARERIFRTLVDSVARTRRTRPRQEIRLTARQLEVLTLLAEGLTNKTIAERLSISPRTAEAHRAHLMKKLAVRSQAALLRAALARGLIDFHST